MMYVPASFGVLDQGILDSFIRRYAFATLVASSSGGPIASHIPISLAKFIREHVEEQRAGV
jgi:predicted FMN-binding regulatory protein PaiB